MDKLPVPPTASDPITWIAIVLVFVLLVGVIVWLPRLFAAFREDQKAALAVFAAELKAEREHHAAAVDGLHDRLNSIQTDITKIAARSAA